MSCGCEGLKNFIISRGSIKIYSMYVINNHLYSILKLCEESKNIYKLIYLYMVDWYTAIWTGKESEHSEYSELTSWITINLKTLSGFRSTQSSWIWSITLG